MSADRSFAEIAEEGVAWVYGDQYEPPVPIPDAPLIVREDSTVVPPTWCVVVCEQGCDQSWTVDTAEFDPPLSAQQVENLLTPLLIAHETEHGKRW